MKKYIPFALLVFLLSCNADKNNTNETATDALPEPYENVDCLIKYLDALFLGEKDYCDDMKPLKIITGIDTTLYMNKRMSKDMAIANLNRLTGYESKFKFNGGFSGSLSITNYSDSLYLEERKAWRSALNQ